MGSQIDEKVLIMVTGFFTSDTFLRESYKLKLREVLSYEVTSFLWFTRIETKQGKVSFIKTPKWHF